MDTESRDKIRKALKVLKTMYEADTITLGDYGKTVVGLAYECMAGDEVHLAIGLINEVPNLYYAENQSEHLREDSEYAEKCVYLQKQLKVRGVSAETHPGVNMRPARA